MKPLHLQEESILHPPKKKFKKILQKLLTPDGECGIILLALNECHTREWWNW